MREGNYCIHVNVETHYGEIRTIFMSGRMTKAECRERIERIKSGREDYGQFQYYAFMIVERLSSGRWINTTTIYNNK